jgi:hypothetical protein
MAFDSVSIADNTTIVGGSASAANRKDLLRDRIDEYDSTSTYPKKGRFLQKHRLCVGRTSIIRAN